MSLAVAIPSVKSLARANCSICEEEYNNSNRLPKVVCTNGHTMCLTCLDRIIHCVDNNAKKCPTCQNPFPLPAEAQAFPSNFALLDLLTAFEKNEQRFSVSQAICTDCGSAGTETMFFVCVPCGKKKGVYCNVDSLDFDWQQLSNITLCAACILSQHNRPGHTYVKLLKLRIRRDRRDMKNIVTGAQRHMSVAIAACKEANELAENTVKELLEMVDLTNNCDSSLVLADAKLYIERANSSLVATAASLQKAANRHMGEFKAQSIVNLRQKNSLAMHCTMEEEEPEEEEVKEQEKVEEKKTEEQHLVEKAEQAAGEYEEHSEIVRNQMNNEVALSQMGLILAVSTVLLIVIPIIQSPFVWNSVSGLFSFVFWCVARLFGA